MSGLTLIVATALATVILSLVYSHHTARQDRRHMSRSNARVLAEYKAICIHRPHHVVDHRKDHP